MSGKNSMICLVTGFLVGAMFNWPLSYGENDLWGLDHRYYMVITTFVLAFLLKRMIKSTVSSLALLFACGVVLAPLLRVLYELMMDSTSNYLWPISLAIYILLIFPTAFLGAFVEQMFRRSRMG